MITFRNLGKYGRLGNQLFQFASTVGIALSRGEGFIFPEDWMYRPYFMVPSTFFGPIPDHAVESTEYAQHLDPRARPYLQDLNLFWEYIELIRTLLMPSNLAMESMRSLMIPGSPRLGVHVRRGDNVFDPGVANKSDYHKCPPLDYYLRGIEHFGDPVEQRMVISDDIPWCKENIAAEFYGEGIAHPKENEPTYATTPPRDWFDLFLLGVCDRLVISGSTFGIWGAILAETDEVIRPDEVYGPIVAAYTDSELLFPKEWKAISAA